MSPHTAELIRVRTASADDTATLVEGNCAMARETESRELDHDRITRGVAKVLADARRGTYYIAEIDGTPAGQMLITTEWSDWRDGWFWWIQSVYVCPAFRGRGVYRALQEHVTRLARATGDVCGLRLYVERENAGARAVYEKLGMTRTSYRLYERDWSDS